MVGRRAGVSTKLRERIPWLVNIQCLAHGLELAASDTIKAHDRMKKTSDMIHGLYKQYHYSPKAWRELKEVGEALQLKVWKPTNLGGTRWLPHISKALQTLIKNYAPLLVHLQHTAEGNTSSHEMMGRARQTARVLKDHRQMLFIQLVVDIIDVLGRYKSMFFLFLNITVYHSFFSSMQGKFQLPTPPKYSATYIDTLIKAMILVFTNFKI